MKKLMSAAVVIVFIVLLCGYTPAEGIRDDGRFSVIQCAAAIPVQEDSPARHTGFISAANSVPVLVIENLTANLARQGTAAEVDSSRRLPCRERHFSRFSGIGGTIDGNEDKIPRMPTVAVISANEN